MTAKEATRSDRSPFAPRARSLPIGALLLVVVVAIVLFTNSSRDAFAAAAPVTQCNSETASNVGGQGARCSVIVVNYVTSTGELADSPPSSLTTTICAGAAGPVEANGVECSTTTTQILGQPITSIQQCDAEANGGGGVLICTASITNHFLVAPADAPTPALVYECVGSVITGTGAPGVCDPNSNGVTSVGQATVGQCNGSGNGGTSVGFTCSVTGGSTTSTTLPVHIDQCNGSSNEGGALTICTGTVVNDVVLQVPTATPTVPTATPTVPTATPTVPTATPTVPTATPTVPTATPTVPTATPTIPTGLETPVLPVSSPPAVPVLPTGTPPSPGVPTPPPSTSPPTSTPPLGQATETVRRPAGTPTAPISTPQAPSTGSGPTAVANGTNSGLDPMLGFALVAIALVAFGFSRRRSSST